MIDYRATPWHAYSISHDAIKDNIRIKLTASFKDFHEAHNYLYNENNINEPIYITSYDHSQRITTYSGDLELLKKRKK